MSPYADGMIVYVQNDNKSIRQWAAKINNVVQKPHWI